MVTQKVDVADTNLGFFVRWIEKLAERADITVIANEVHTDAAGHLPQNVSVDSLGRESGASRPARFFRFQKLLWRHLPQADGVFFHMCPEYVLGAHFLPHFFRVKTLLWYVHKEVSWRLRLATQLVDKIFTASPESCRLRSRKVEVVGHGIDSNTNYEQDTKLRKGTETKALHLVTVGRIAPVKDLRTIILGFLELQKRFPKAVLSIVGEPVTEGDGRYAADLRRSFSGRVRFLGGVPHGELPRLHGEATVFVHASKTGSMDKAVLEALAAGLPVFTSSEAFIQTQIHPSPPRRRECGADIRGLDIGVHTFREGDPKDLAEQIEHAVARGEIGYNGAGREWVRRNHSLNLLVQKIIDFYQCS